MTLFHQASDRLYSEVRELSSAAKMIIPIDLTIKYFSSIIRLFSISLDLVEESGIATSPSHIKL